MATCILRVDGLSTDPRVWGVTTLMHCATTLLLCGQACLCSVLCRTLGIYCAASLSFIATGLYRQTFI